MKNKHYNIILQPLAKYFFGGERHYDDKDGVFYFERSRAFPQQTSVLGMLRYQLLLENSLMEQAVGSGAKINPNKKEIAAELIGQQSFNGITSTLFGKLFRLSPINIQSEDGRIWLMYPKARQKDKPLEDINIEFLDGGRLSLGKNTSDIIPFLTNFNHKKGLEYGFLHPESGDYLLFDDVFEKKIKEEEQIGIYKPYRNHPNGVVTKTEDEGFYKYQFMQLKPGFSFSCTIELDKNTSIDDNKVRLGKEGTPFSLKVKEKTPPIEEVIQKGDRILLTSDAYLPKNWKAYCKATISRPQSFRNLSYKMGKTSNYDDNPAEIKTPLLNLVQRGTLLYVKDDDQAATDLHQLFVDQIPYRNIGYNHFTILKSY